MKGMLKVGLSVIVFALFMGLGVVLAQDEGQEGIEVETRGPVHEAFAEPVDISPQPGIIVSKAPPAAIEEMPPDEQPEGSIWIPGYWAWDDDRGDFIWVSGIWRVPPPGYNWVPGYWTQVEQGFQWTPGFWMTQQTQQIEYLPPPPATLEVGPSTPPPSENQIWVPGTWYWRERYVWRPGYWLQVRPDWIWVPAHYVWTPRGVIFTEGYWDYAVARRGVLFAPVYVERRVIVGRPLRYTPTIVISPDVLQVHLFSRPRYTHYYFGDYYAKTYVRQGIYPWFQTVEKRRVYDPIIVHREWQLRQSDPHWRDNVVREYRLRQEEKLPRPPRTLALQRTVIQRVPERNRSAYVIGQPLRQFVAVKNAPLQFAPVTKDRRELIIRQDNDIRKFRDQRVQWEARSAVKAPTKAQGPAPAPVFKPQTVKIANPWLNRTPAAVPNRTLGTPPPRPQQPKIDTNARPPSNMSTVPQPRTNLTPPSRTVQPLPETKRPVTPGTGRTLPGAMPDNRTRVVTPTMPRPESTFRPGVSPSAPSPDRSRTTVTIPPSGNRPSGLTPPGAGRMPKPGTGPLRGPGTTPDVRTGTTPRPNTGLLSPRTPATSQPRPQVITPPSRGTTPAPSLRTGPPPSSIQVRPNPGATIRSQPNTIRRPESRPADNRDRNDRARQG